MKMHAPLALAALFAAVAAAADGVPDPSPAGSVPSPVPEDAAPLLDDAPAEGSAAPTSGEELLAQCAARMPAERILLSGRLNMRKTYGVSLLAFDFSVEADLGAAPPRFRYDLSDHGTNLLSVTAVRDPVRGLVLSRADGGPAPAPSDAVLGTDLSWFDVGVDFVWWRDPVLVGTDRLKGRTCDLLEVTPPEPTQDCAKARLWIDRDQKVVMQAVQLDVWGRERRKLWIDGTKKVKGRWVFKILEVETTGTIHRTRLRFDDISFPDSPPPPDRR